MSNVPYEIIEHIAGFLPPKDAVSVFKTNTLLYARLNKKDMLNYLLTQTRFKILINQLDLINLHWPVWPEIEDLEVLNDFNTKRMFISAKLGKNLKLAKKYEMYLMMM
jgi:hypothetical protein